MGSILAHTPIFQTEPLRPRRELQCRKRLLQAKRLELRPGSLTSRNELQISAPPPQPSLGFGVKGGTHTSHDGVPKDVSETWAPPGLKTPPDNGSWDCSHPFKWTPEPVSPAPPQELSQLEVGMRLEAESVEF